MTAPIFLFPRFFEYNRAFMEATRMTKVELLHLILQLSECDCRLSMRIIFFLKVSPNKETTISMTVPIPNPSNLPLLIAMNIIQDCLRNTTLYKLVDPSNLHAAQQCVARLLINSTQSEHSFLRYILAVSSSLFLTTPPPLPTIDMILT